MEASTTKMPSSSGEFRRRRNNNKHSRERERLTCCCARADIMKRLKRLEKLSRKKFSHASRKRSRSPSDSSSSESSVSSEFSGKFSSRSSNYSSSDSVERNAGREEFPQRRHSLTKKTEDKKPRTSGFSNKNVSGKKIFVKEEKLIETITIDDDESMKKRAPIACKSYAKHKVHERYNETQNCVNSSCVQQKSNAAKTTCDNMKQKLQKNCQCGRNSKQNLSVETCQNVLKTKIATLQLRRLENGIANSTSETLPGNEESLTNRAKSENVSVNRESNSTRRNRESSPSICEDEEGTVNSRKVYVSNQQSTSDNGSMISKRVSIREKKHGEENLKSLPRETDNWRHGNTFTEDSASTSENETMDLIDQRSMNIQRHSNEMGDAGGSKNNVTRKNFAGKTLPKLRSITLKGKNVARRVQSGGCNGKNRCIGCIPSRSGPILYKRTGQRENKHIIKCAYPRCDKVFVSPTGARYHYNTQHIGQRSICKYCKKLFMSSQNLKNHIRSFH